MLSFITSNSPSFVSPSHLKKEGDSQVYSSFDLTPFTSEKKQLQRPPNIPLLSLHSLEAANHMAS